MILVYKILTEMLIISDAKKLPENTYAITGSSATLSCIMAADNAKATVRWFFKGVQMVQSKVTQLDEYDASTSTTKSLR